MLLWAANAMWSWALNSDEMADGPDTLPATAPILPVSPPGRKVFSRPRKDDTAPM